MAWLQISINTTKNHAELTEGILFSAGALTVTLTDAADQPILEPGVNEAPVWNDVIITGLFEPDVNQQQLLETINQSLVDTNFSYDIETLEDQNWTRAWMDHYHAMQFGKRLWVCPLHLEPPDPNAVNLRLDPGLAFGTGTHPTTALCLKWLERHPPTGRSVLDFGCGSGILAIAALKLGAARAVAVDHDPQALLATRQNVRIFVGQVLETNPLQSDQRLVPRLISR